MARSVVLARYGRYALYVLAALALLWLTRSKGGPAPGAEAPGFDLPIVARASGSGAITTSKRWALDDHKGKPLLIEVFASWCGTCQRSAPTLADAHQKYGDQLEFLGVSMDDTVEAAARAKQRWHIPYAVAHDDRGVFARAYKIRVLPTFVLLDQDGRIAEVSTGAPSSALVAKWAASVAH